MSSDQDKRGNAGGLPARIGVKAARRIKARRSRKRGVWFGLGMFGLVGWTVAIYTVLGVFLGHWLDRRWPQGFSWTLSMLFIGLLAGLLNAWHWIRKESRMDENDDGDSSQGEKNS